MRPAMHPRLPPPDPHEPLRGDAPEGVPVPAPTAIFLAGPPSPGADRLSDLILAYRPGALFVVAAD